MQPSACGLWLCFISQGGDQLPAIQLSSLPCSHLPASVPISCHAVQEGLEEPLIAVAAADSDAEELSPLHMYLLKSQRA